MKVADFRAELGLSLEAFAAKVGLGSKGYAHAIENGGKCSVKVALEIERLSGGRVKASSLNPDVGLVENARGIAA